MRASTVRERLPSNLSASFSSFARDFGESVTFSAGRFRSESGSEKFLEPRLRSFMTQRVRPFFVALEDSGGPCTATAVQGGSAAAARSPRRKGRL